MMTLSRFADTVASKLSPGRKKRHRIRPSLNVRGGMRFPGKSSSVWSVRERASGSSTCDRSNAIRVVVFSGLGLEAGLDG